MTASRRRRRGERYTFYAIRPSSSTEFLGRSLLCTEERRPEYSKICLCKANKPSYTHCTEYTIRVHYHVRCGAADSHVFISNGRTPKLCVFMCVCRVGHRQKLIYSLGARQAMRPAPVLESLTRACADTPGAAACGRRMQRGLRGAQGAL